MKNWKNTLINSSATIRDAMEAINSSSLQIALIVDEKRRLLGTVTDGDIRRAILKGVSLGSVVPLVMNSNPTVVNSNDGREKILQIMKSKELERLPVVDNNGFVVGLEVIDNFIGSVTRDNWVFLMAGGTGTRLRPLTNSCPKPLLSVGKKPILETIIENFLEYGFQKFYISVNYKAQMIKEHIGNGGKWNIEINYIDEEKRLGTAGSLSMLKERPKYPIIVMNGDLLTKVNIKHLIDFHNNHKAQGTMCIREYDLQVPYGVVNIDDLQVLQIKEKPVHSFFVNAGIYVLEPDILDLIPAGEYFDMTTLLEKLIEQKRKLIAFPINEYWIDIGHMEDFHRANGEFASVFNKDQ